MNKTYILIGTTTSVVLLASIAFRPQKDVKGNVSSYVDNLEESSQFVLDKATQLGKVVSNIQKTTEVLTDVFNTQLNEY